ncbi:unnamed protein product [Peniophora sp. CBMAI 1063]|nr:unnamed protein product [Peniophora sp. CBMAI 1063]
MSRQITFYTSRICPWAQRVAIAFAEAGVEPKEYRVDLANKPSWYHEVNPALKVPAVTYGGPDVPADKPSPESVKIAESGVLIEFLADLYPGLLPTDPVERAKARFFIETASSKFHPGFGALFMRGEGPDALFAGLEAVQSLLPEEGFAIGQWSIADAAIQPFLGRLELLLRNDVGKFAEGEGPKIYKEIFENEKFARVAKYIKEFLARDSWKVTWDEESVLELQRRRFGRS